MEEKPQGNVSSEISGMNFDELKNKLVVTLQQNTALRKETHLLKKQESELCKALDKLSMEKEVPQIKI